MQILKKTYYALEFVLFYFVKLVQSNIYIAFDILTPNLKISPGIVKVPLNISSDFGLLAFSNLLSMTPGTLTVDISEDKKVIIVHVLYSKNREVVMFEIDQVQQKIKKIFN